MDSLQLRCMWDIPDFRCESIPISGLARVSPQNSKKKASASHAPSFEEVILVYLSYVFQICSLEVMSE